MDNKSKKGKADDIRININQDYELSYWSKKFNVTRDQLREAVKTVGVMVKDVELFFNHKNN